jgi:hypothetical protein
VGQEDREKMLIGGGEDWRLDLLESKEAKGASVESSIRV